MPEYKMKLRDVRDFADVEKGTPEGIQAASMIIMQSAGLAALCAVALDAAIGGWVEVDGVDVMIPCASVMAKVSDDLQAANDLAVG